MTNPGDLKQTLSHFLWKNEEPKHNENNKWSLCFSHQPPHFQKPLAGVQSEMIMNSRRSLTLDRHTPTRKCFPHCFLRSACREKQNTEREDDSFSVTWFNYTNCGIAFKFQLSNDVAKPRHVCKYWNEQCSEKWKSKVQQSGLLVSNCSQTLHSWSTTCVCDTWGVSMIFSDSIITDAFPRRLPPSLACCRLPAFTNGDADQLINKCAGICSYIADNFCDFLFHLLIGALRYSGLILSPRILKEGVATVCCRMSSRHWTKSSY